MIDGAGAFLMPGMTEAHTHFAWNDQPSLSAIQMMPPEEHILWCVRVAKRYLDMGWTSCVGAATAKPRLDVVIRNAINDGTIIGPRYLAASQEITVPGGLGDTTQPHLYAANHLSAFDIPALYVGLPFQFRIMAKQELFRYPFLGWHLRRSGQVPIRIVSWCTPPTAPPGRTMVISAGPPPFIDCSTWNVE